MNQDKKGFRVLETMNQKVLVGMTGENEGKFYVGLRDRSLPPIKATVSMVRGSRESIELNDPEGTFFAVYFTLPDTETAEYVADTLEEMASDLRQAIKQYRHRKEGFTEILFLE